MTTTYVTLFEMQNSAGRFANLTATPTVTAYRVDTKASLGAATWENIATGLYKAFITSATDGLDVSFYVAVAAADQPNFRDAASLHQMAFVHEIRTDISGIPAAVWAVTTRTLSSFGTLVADVWANATRTLSAFGFTVATNSDANVTAIKADTTAIKDKTDDLTFTVANKVDAYITWAAADISASITAGAISQIRGNDWDIDIEDLTLDSNLIQVVIKRSDTYSDAQALLFIDTDTGLITVNGAAATDAAQASLSYSGTTLTVAVGAAITALLPIGTWVYGIQSITAGGVVSEVYGGSFEITADKVWATA
jgi:hypothetical protein